MSEVFGLYNGDERLTVDHSKIRHRYLIEHKLPDGQWTEPTIIEGVTNYLKVIPKDLMFWSAGVASQYWVDLLLSGEELTLSKSEVFEHHLAAKAEHTRLSGKGKNKGTDYHTLMEYYFNDPKKYLHEFGKATPEVRKLVDRTVVWWENSGWTLIGCETGVYSRQLGYGGKIDLEAITATGKRVVCDFKSTKLSRMAPNGVYLEYFFQEGGYALPRREEGIEIDDLVILNPNHVDAAGDMLPVYASTMDMAVEDAIHAFTICKTLTDTIAYWEAKKGRL